MQSDATVTVYSLMLFAFVCLFVGLLFFYSVRAFVLPQDVDYYQSQFLQIYFI
jgi:hypothetical protein